MYEDIRVKKYLDNFYKECGHTEAYRGSNGDPNSCNYMERRARSIAHKNSDLHDKVVLNRMIKTCETDLHMKYDQALALLMRLGIFLVAVEERSK